MRRFDIYSYLIIFIFTLILILRIRWMPTFIDVYYHLLTTLNFVKAGGITTLSFWEYAPFGRPHLYPPLLHLLMLITYKLNANILTVARIFELLSFPLVLFTIYITIRNLFNPRLAFWSVLISSSMYSFYLSSVGFLPASLSLILGLLTFYSLERDKIIASIVFMTLSFYTQVSISLFFLANLIIYGLLNRERLRLILTIVFFSLIFYLPLLMHQLRYLAFFEPGRIRENFPFELNILVYILAILGIFLAFKKKRRYMFFLSSFCAGLIFLPLRYRFFSGQGMLGIILLASLALDFFYDRISTRTIERGRNLAVLIYFLLVFFGIFFISSTITIIAEEVKFNLIGSTYVNVFPSQEIRIRSNELSIYMPKTFAPVFKVVNEYTNANDLITANYEYLAGFVAVFTDRRTSTAMLPEIRPFREVNPFKFAKLIIWLKDPEATSWQPHDLIENLKLVKIAETDIFYIYKNPKAESFDMISKRSLSSNLCLGILFLMLFMASFDLCRKNN